MFWFAVRRLIFGASLVLFSTALSFFLVHRDSTRVARTILGETATDAQVEARATELGLDRPIVTQYLDWLSDAVTGDFGTSYFSSEQVTSMLASRAPVTLSIVAAGVVVAAIVSVALGMLAAVRGGWADRSVQVVSVIGLSVPNFWLALVLVLTFAVRWQLFPATGYVGPRDSISGWLAVITLPTAALALNAIAATTQQVRSAVLEVLDADFVRTLRSRGIPERSILFRHALKNAASPALTVLALQFIGLLGGAIVIEKVFALPGLGTAAVNATTRGDMPVLLGVVSLTVIIVVVTNLMIDVANGWVNPKANMR